MFFNTDSNVSSKKYCKAADFFDNDDIVQDSSQNSEKMENNSENCNKLENNSKDCQKREELPKNCQESENSFKDCQESENSSKNCQESENSSENCQESEKSSKNCQETENSSNENNKMEDSPKSDIETENSSNEPDKMCNFSEDNQESENLSPKNIKIEDSSKNAEKMENSSNDDKNNTNSSQENKKFDDFLEDDQKIENASKNNSEIKNCQADDSSSDDCIIIEQTPKEIEVITITDEFSTFEDWIKIENNNNNYYYYNQVTGKIQSGNVNPFDCYNKFFLDIHDRSNKKKRKKERQKQLKFAENFEKLQLSLRPENRGESVSNPEIVSNQSNFPNPKNWANFLNPGNVNQNFINQRNGDETKNQKLYPEIDNVSKKFKESKIPAIQEGNSFPSTSRFQYSNPAPSLPINTKRKEKSDLSNPPKKLRIHENSQKSGNIEFGREKIIHETRDEPMDTGDDYNNQNDDNYDNKIVHNSRRPEKQAPYVRGRLATKNQNFIDNNSWPILRMDVELSHKNNDHPNYPSTSGNAKNSLQPATLDNDWESFVKRQQREQILKRMKKNFYTSTKTRLSDQDLFAQDNDLIKVILPKDFRKNGITRFQRDRVLNEIFARIGKIKSGPFPRFKDAYIRHGGIVIECEDKWSTDWLIDVVPNLKPWEGAKLSLVDLHYLEKFYRAILWIPGPLRIPEIVLNKLETLNPALKTRKWRIHSCEETLTPEGFQIFLGIPNSSINSLEEMRFQTFVGMFKGFITVSNEEYKD